MLNPRPYTRLLVLEPGPGFWEEPLGSCDWHALETLTQKLQGNPVTPNRASIFKVKQNGRVRGRNVLMEPRPAQPEGPAPPELTGHGEGGQEGSLDGLGLWGWRWGRGLLLLLPLRVVWVFHGNIPVFDVFVPPVLEWLSAYTVR